MGMLDILMPKTSADKPAPELPVYVPPDVSYLTDRELAERTYLAIDKAVFTIDSLTSSLHSSPIFKRLETFL